MSYLDGVLQAKRVLVTGATGFIGSRLAQRLTLEEGAVVTGTGRKMEKVPHLADAGVNLQQVDLIDATAMRQQVTGQEIIFHLAWLGRETGAVGVTHDRNVQATERLLRLAAEAGVGRFVFASSINAYGPPKRDIVDETHPVNTKQRDAYGRAKAVTEQLAGLLAHELGLELVVVRPAMVYGPCSKTWTVRMLEMVQKGVPVIFGDGRGNASPLFIENLIDGLLLTATRPEAADEAFNFSDPPVGWQEFFGYYGTMCGRKPRGIPLWAARILALASEKLRLGIPLTRERLDFYVRQSVFPTTKAEQLLGYRPRVPLDEGMNLAEAWLREERLLAK
jgi:nucleoside-diphosphate-sugar epimerase